MCGLCTLDLEAESRGLIFDIALYCVVMDLKKSQVYIDAEAGISCFYLHSVSIAVANCRQSTFYY